MVRNLMLALLCGALTFQGCRESFWHDLITQPWPQKGGALPILFYYLGRGLLFVHDSVGTPGTVCLLGLATLFFCCQALGGNNRR